MTMLARKPEEVKSEPNVSFLWLELTGRCGLTCAHCYAGSSPSGSHGVMTGGQRNAKWNRPRPEGMK